MAVSAIILTLTPDAAARASLLEDLAAESALHLGTLDGAYLPAAVEASTSAECRDVCERLLERPGIWGLSVVSVDFSEEAACEAS